MRTQAPRSSNRRAYINANIVAPAQNLNGKGGILIEDGWILQCGPKVTRESVGASYHCRRLFRTDPRPRPD